MSYTDDEAADNFNTVSLNPDRTVEELADALARFSYIAKAEVVPGDFGPMIQVQLRDRGD